MATHSDADSHKLPPADMTLDPVYLHARREAIVIILLFATFLVWSILTCYFGGYVDSGPSGQVPMVFGLPSWVFWGIFVPWITVDLVAVWFCFVFMKDDPLGDDGDSASTKVTG